MNAIDIEAVAARHPHLVERPLSERLRLPIMAAACVTYLVFSYWFFAIGSVFGTANWSIAGSYLADWVSFEQRPDIRLEGDYLTVTFPKNSGLGANPQPDWLVREETSVTRTETVAPAANAQQNTNNADSIFMTPAVPDTNATTVAPERRTVTESVVTNAIVNYSDTVSVQVVPGMAVVRNGGETLQVPMVPDQPIRAIGPLPAWAVQPNDGGKIILSFGFTGWAEIENDRVRIRNRFFGWENFFFDTNSRFFGKPYSEVIGLLFSGERVDPAMSNAQRAWLDILYNPSWQHLDVWTKLLQTIVMAFVGTVFACILAFPLAFMAARNITASRISNQLVKRLFDFLRSVDMLIWALFFTRAFGPGPLAGISAIFLTDTGTLGKLYAEALENIDNKPREGVASVGAPPVTVQRFGVLPQVLPVFVSQALYFWESNTRSATIIGAVGAGGIGLKLWEAMRTNSDWENVAYMVVLILIVVYIFDMVSNMMRSRLIGTASR